MIKRRYLTLIHGIMYQDQVGASGTCRIVKVPTILEDLHKVVQPRIINILTAGDIIPTSQSVNLSTNRRRVLP